MFSNGFRPVLAGRLRDNARSTELRARYGAPAFLKVFLAVWYSLLLYVVGTKLIGFVGGFITPDEDTMVLVMGAGLAAVPILFHFVFNWYADDHLTEMLRLLVREADFDVIEGFEQSEL